MLVFSIPRSPVPGLEGRLGSVLAAIGLEQRTCRHVASESDQ